MGDCLIHRAGSPFKAFMEVTATPGSTVTATLSGTDIIYTGTADSDGKVNFILKKKGVYTVTSNASGTQTKTITALIRKEVHPVNLTGAFTLTAPPQIINELTATTIIVNRTASPYGGGVLGNLSDGATIYHGDVLAISADVVSATVYNPVTLTVDGVAFTSGNTVTVSADVAVSATTTVKSYTLTITNATINNKTAATVSVSRNSSTYAGAPTGAVTAGANKIYYGDVLTISVSNANTTVYNNPSLKVDNVAFTSGGTKTVAANLTAVGSSSVKSWALALSAGTGSSLGVSRTSSTYAGAGNGALSNGSTVYYGDVITKTSGGASTGFNTYTISQSGVTGTANAGPWTVTGTTVKLAASAKPIQYKLTKSLNGNYGVTVRRTARSTAGTAAGAGTNVEIGNNGIIYYGDTLSFTPAPATYYTGNYTATGLNSNISKQNSTLSRSVTGNVSVTSTSSRIRYTVSVIGVNSKGTAQTNYNPYAVWTVNAGDYLYNLSPRPFTSSSTGKTSYYDLEKVASFPGYKPTLGAKTNSQGDPIDDNGNKITVYPLEISMVPISDGTLVLSFKVYLWNSSNYYTKRSDNAYTNASRTTKWDGRARITGNVTLYALYTEIR